MTKSEIIAKTFEEMSSRGGESDPEYDEHVRATLSERLPEGDNKTCADFAYLNTVCCESCHTAYPHYDMYVVDLSDEGKAWICCAVRSALFPATRPDG